MNDLPDERPLDDTTRARLRADLIAATAQPQARRTSWVAPIAASVAILAIVGTTGALLAFGGDDEPAGGRELAPAGSGPAEAESTAPQAIEPEETVGPDPAIGETEGAVPIPPLGNDAPSTCAVDIVDWLPKGKEAAAIEYDGGRAELWSDGTTWFVCDSWAAESDGGVTTLIGGRKLTAPVTKEAFRISQNYAMKDEMSSQFFAGGPTIPDVTSISYAFPDGHVVEAEIGDRMWLMAYLPARGPLVDGDGTTEPVIVEVTRAGGAVEEFTLDWATDTCAQVNHGC